MHTIEFTDDIRFGETIIDQIKVKPITFVELVNVWTRTSGVASRGGKGNVLYQRERIVFQTHFMSKGERVMPQAENINQLPLGLAKSIIAALDFDQGKPGKVLQAGDGSITPVLYQLGTPMSAKSGKGEEVIISELEFKAATYGEVEEVLASENEMTQTVALLRTIAKPVVSTGNLMVLPGWALDRITPADGILIMRHVLPNF